MKWLLAALFVLGAALVAIGVPGAGPDPVRTPQFGTGIALLPMRFSHNDHFATPCATCHHEFLDGTAGLACMTCHVTDAKVAPLLEDQFHTLCRSCHVREHAAGQASGPTRRCIACHRPDDHF